MGVALSSGACLLGTLLPEHSSPPRGCLGWGPPFLCSSPGGCLVLASAFTVHPVNTCPALWVPTDPRWLCEEPQSLCWVLHPWESQRASGVLRSPPPRNGSCHENWSVGALSSDMGPNPARALGAWSREGAQFRAARWPQLRSGCGPGPLAAADRELTSLHHRRKIPCGQAQMLTMQFPFSLLMNRTRTRDTPLLLGPCQQGRGVWCRAEGSWAWVAVGGQQPTGSGGSRAEVQLMAG